MAPGRGGGMIMGPDTIGTPGLWAGFLALVVGMLALDLGIFQRRPHAVGWREAIAWSAAWVGLALLFNVGIYAWFGPQRALEFLTGYLIEKALSVDNLFVFLVIFGYFGIPAALQHRVLFWGILGALMMRAAAIVGGGVLLQTFHWTIYLFGAFLVLTGVRLWRTRHDGFHPETHPAVRLLIRVLPVTAQLHGARFLVRQGARRLVTPLLLALITVEVADVAFAVDSIPAIFAISSDPFIVFTSNIFAILGLRALYFLLAGGLVRLRYLSEGLAAVMVFVGAKMLVSGFVAVPIGVSLGVIALLLGTSVVASRFSDRAIRPNPSVPGESEVAVGLDTGPP